MFAQKPTNVKPHTSNLSDLVIDKSQSEAARKLTQFAYQWEHSGFKFNTAIVARLERGIYAGALSATEACELYYSAIMALSDNAICVD